MTAPETAVGTSQVHVARASGLLVDERTDI